MQSESFMDRIFFDYKDAVDTYLRMGFEFTEDKRLILNNAEAIIKKQGQSIWRSTIVYEHKTNPEVLLV